MVQILVLRSLGQNTCNSSVSIKNRKCSTSATLDFRKESTVLCYFWKKYKCSVMQKICIRRHHWLHNESSQSRECGKHASLSKAFFVSFPLPRGSNKLNLEKILGASKQTKKQTSRSEIFTFRGDRFLGRHRHCRTIPRFYWPLRFCFATTFSA